MKNYILLALSAVLFSSCLFHIITDNYYDYLEPDQKTKIKKLENFESTKPGFVYEITGTELMDELKNHDKSMIYVFANSCPSHSVNHLYEEKKYAEENGFNLILVMHSYTNMNSTLQKDLGLPIFAIDSEAYEIKKSRKYYKKFREDIGFYAYKETLDGMWPGRYLFYEKDKLVDGKNYLTEEQEKAAKARE